jgi:hypothetical protein
MKINTKIMSCFEASISSPLPYLQVSTHDIETDDKDRFVNRNWMEYLEILSGPGAYEVLRCDLIYDFKSRIVKDTMWGLDYHLTRLQMSFRELVRNDMHLNSDHLNRIKLDILDEHILDRAKVESKTIIDALILKHKCTYEKELSTCKKQERVGDGDNCTRLILVKVTLFWTPTVNANTKSIGITVRGHANTDGQVINPLQRPDTIITSLALPPPHESDDGNDNGDNTTRYMLPDRITSPHAKISTWLQEKRSLERQNTFQPKGVKEILLLLLRQDLFLIQHHTSNFNHDLKDYEILEGTSSNFFAIYQDNTIRTAQKGVLFGYIRHLVLKYAAACGLELDPRPCKIEDCMNGLWVETFITSSSRLIHPIQQILVPDYDKGTIRTMNDKKGGSDGDKDGGGEEHAKINTQLHWKELWRYEKDRESLTKSVAKWKLLLDEILAHVGYH